MCALAKTGLKNQAYLTLDLAGNAPSLESAKSFSYEKPSAFVKFPCAHVGPIAD